LATTFFATFFGAFFADFFADFFAADFTVFFFLRAGAAFFFPDFFFAFDFFAMIVLRIGAATNGILIGPVGDQVHATRPREPPISSRPQTGAPPHAAYAP
jgi:hypothetical protein